MSAVVVGVHRHDHRHRRLWILGRRRGCAGGAHGEHVLQLDQVTEPGLARTAGEVHHFSALVVAGHEPAPRHCRIGAAGHLAHGDALVGVPQPHRGGQMGSEPDEPGIGRLLGGAGFARRGLQGQLGPPASAVDHVVLQNVGGPAGRARRHHPLARQLMAVEHVSLTVDDLLDEVGLVADPTGADHPVGRCHVDGMDLFGAQRQRRHRFQLGGDTHLGRGVDHRLNARHPTQPQECAVGGHPDLVVDGIHLPGRAGEVVGHIGVGNTPGVGDLAGTPPTYSIAGLVALLEQGHHDERLECRPWLTGALSGQVELLGVLGEPRSTHHGSHCPAVGLEGSQGHGGLDTAVVALVVLRQGGGHCGLGLSLGNGIERCVDAEAAVEHQIEPVFGTPAQIPGVVQKLLLHLFHEIALGRQLDLIDLLGQRLEVVQVGLFGGDVAQLGQAVQHDLPLPKGPQGIVDGVVAAGVADERSQKCSLPPSQIGGIQPPVHLGRGLHAVGALAEVHRVQVQVEDLVLFHLPLKALGHGHLLELALGLHLVAHHQVLDELLGDGGTALGDAPGSHVLESGPEHRAEVDAGVQVEVLILDGNHRVLHLFGNVVELHQDPVLHVAEHVDELAVGVVDV